MRRLRAILSLVFLLGLLAALQFAVLRSGKVEPPRDPVSLFPPRCKFAFRLAPQRLLSVLPPEVSERMGARGRMLASSASVVGAATADFGEVFLLVRGAPKYERLAELMRGEAEKTLVGGREALAGDGVCLVMLDDRSFFAVFGENAASLALARLKGDEKEKRRLSPNLEKRLAGGDESVIAGFCGFPGPLTPPLLPGEGPRLLQQQTRFFSLDLKRLENGMLFVRLNLYFPSVEARELVAMTLPGMLAGAAADYPFLEELVKRVRYHRGTKKNLRVELAFPPQILEPLFNPPPPPSPLIPDVPEFPQ